MKLYVSPRPRIHSENREKCHHQDNPRGSKDSTIVELDPKDHSNHGFGGPNSIIVVCMDPLGTVFR